MECKNHNPTGDRVSGKAGGRTRVGKGERAPATGHWLWGRHAVAAALANPRRRCRRLLATDTAARKLDATPIAVTIATSTAIDSRLPEGAVHQGLALLVDSLPGHSLDTVTSPTGKPVVALVLDRITDPQNVGAILRSAAAFDASGVILTGRHSPGESGTLAKAASGALETVPLVRSVNLVRALGTLREAGFWIVGLEAAAATGLPQLDLPDRCIFVVGAEGRGLRTLVRETCDFMARIPMPGAMESLNVGAGASIALYEWTRQLRP